MENFISSNQKKIKRVLTRVEQYDKDLSALKTWWGKIALTGKINSYEVASTILVDMDTTLRKFNFLQERLITSLIHEHTRKVIFQNTSRCQMAIDVLIRNLFERTADIDFLSTDHDVIQFLEKSDINDTDKAFIGERLQSYINIYSVYQDAMLLKPNGELIFQLSQPSRTGEIKDSLINSAVKDPSSYIEYFGRTDLMGGTKSNLLYANAITKNEETLGIIVLCFRFENELEGIIEHLMSEGEAQHFILTDDAGKTIFAPTNANELQKTSSISLDSSPSIVDINRKSVLKTHVKGNAYQDYAGPKNWHLASLFPLNKIENNDNPFQKAEKNNSSLITDLSALIAADLFDVRRESKLVNDDLQLIVLNGIITAARKEATEFMPVLEEIKKIGKSIDNIFDNSIESLFSTIISGKLEGLRLQASLAVDIMDRNLFERANDCRWWGLSSLLIEELSSSQIDAKNIQKTLAKIHSLYTVYHTLYVYNIKGDYIAFSDDTYSHLIGKPIDADSGGRDVFNLKSPYEYSVSPFKPFDCYKGESTYIYNAAISKDNSQSTIIGGIGIVFDSTVEFIAILNDIIPKESGEVIEGAKALFTNEEGVIISSTSPEHDVGEIFFPDIDIEQLNKEEYIATVVRLDNNKMYLAGVAKSQGYREYKIKDGYKNTILAWVLTPC